MQRQFYDSNGNPITARNQVVDDSLGGRAYYLGRMELELPLGSGAREMGLRPSIFAGMGSVFGVKRPQTNDLPNGLRRCRDNTTGVVTEQSFGSSCSESQTLLFEVPGFREVFYGDTWQPRLSVGFGVNWRSPFGPFRIDLAKALIKKDGDDPKLFTFNVGTQF